MISDNGCITRKDSVLFSDVEESIMMMDIEKGSYYNLDGPAARIWELLETPRRVGELCEMLRTEYEVDEGTCRADVTEFIDHLRQLDLIDVG